MKVKVRIEGAKDLTNQEFMMGTSDPYCVCSIPGAEFKTKEIDNNLNPEWNHDGELDWDGEVDITFTVKDSNNYRADKPMGECILTVAQVLNGFSGELALHLDGKETGKLKLVVEAPTDVSMLPDGVTVPNTSFVLINSSLFLWESKAKSGATLALVNLVAFVYCMLEVSISVSAVNVAMAAVGLGGVAKLAGLPLEMFPSETIAKSKVGIIAEILAQSTNSAVVFATRVVLWQDQALTIRTLVVVYVLRGVTRLMSLSMVAIVIFNLLFSVPLQLKLRKKAIATHVEPLLKKGMMLKEAQLAKIPKYADVATKDD